MLKGLKNKRNTLIGELELMITSVEGETRALDQDELDAFDAKKKEIENIDATIARVEETRFNKMDKEEKKVETEKRSKDEIEKRALDAFFRRESLDSEMRTMLTTTGDNQATIPMTIAEGLLKRLEELCPVLDKCGRRFSSKGVLRLISETSYGKGALTEENAKFHDEDSEFAHIDLSAFKISAMTRASFELLENSSIDLDNYLTDVIVRRLAKEINRLFLVGDGTKKPQGLVQGKQLVQVGAKLVYDDFVTAITSMHPDFLDGAVFIMNRKTFTEVAKLQDANGHKYVQNGIVNGKFTYTIAGIQILVDNNMDNVETGKKPFILANITEAYAINLLQDIVVKTLDQIEFTNGAVVYAGYLMADGRIVNEDAIKVAVVGSGTGTASKATK